MGSELGQGWFSGGSGVGQGLVRVGSGLGLGWVHFEDWPQWRSDGLDSQKSLKYVQKVPTW